MDTSAIDSLGKAADDVFRITKVWEVSWEAIVSSFAVALLGLLIFMIKRGGLSSFQYFRERVQTPRALRNYREGLEKATLALTHSWKLEGQNLERLIVPMYVLGAIAEERMGLDQWVSKAFSKSGEVPRIVLLGDAGSGKSVAMGTIARKMWEVNVAKPPVPVLLSFKEIQLIRTDAALTEVVVRKLKQYQYELRREGAALKFVDNNLKSGGIVLLLDGLDELELNTRLDVALFLRQFFTTYPKVPFIVSSRVALWNQFPSILGELHSRLTLAPFTPLEVKRFVSRWEFPDNKSAGELTQLILSKPYLSKAEENPLLLTIACYLYSQPTGVLPHQRVEFYSVCVGVLMEKWDKSKNLDRVNQFAKADKVDMLCAVAYRLLVENQKAGDEIHRDEVMDVIATVMKKSSLPPEKRQLALDEIINNAELLVETNSDRLKFPHRTFLEYFAALYFFKFQGHIQLLKLYERDPGKWQETLLLFCGMNENLRISNLLFKRMINSHHSSGFRDLTLYRALSEAAIVSSKMADEVVGWARTFSILAIDPEIVECLGRAATNSKSKPIESARKLLLELLGRGLDDHNIVAVCIAVFGFIDVEVWVERVKHNMPAWLIRTIANRLSLASMTKAAGFLETTPKELVFEVIYGLSRFDDNANLVFFLACNSKRADIRSNSTLVFCGIRDFRIFFERIDSKSLVTKMDLTLLNKAKTTQEIYGWSRPHKSTSKSSHYHYLPDFDEQLAFFAIAHGLADLILSGEKLPLPDENPHEPYEVGNKELLYMASAILDKEGLSFKDNNLLGIHEDADQKGLKQHWWNRRPRTLTLIYSIMSIFLIPIVLTTALLFIVKTSHLENDLRSAIPLILFSFLPMFISIWSTKMIISTSNRSFLKLLRLFICSLVNPGTGFMLLQFVRDKSHWVLRNSRSVPMLTAISALFNMVLFYFLVNSYLFLLILFTWHLLTVFASYAVTHTRTAWILPNAAIRKELSSGIL